MMEKKERSEKKEVSPYEIVERGRIFELRRGINYLADNIEKAKDILSMIVSHFGGIPAWIFTSPSFPETFSPSLLIATTAASNNARNPVNFNVLPISILS